MAKIKIGEFELESTEIRRVEKNTPIMLKIVVGIAFFCFAMGILAVIVALFEQNWMNLFLGLLIIPASYFGGIILTTLVPECEIIVTTMSDGKIKKHSRDYSDAHPSDYHELIKYIKNK